MFEKQMIWTIIYHTLQLYDSQSHGVAIQSLQFTTDDGSVHPGPAKFYGQSTGQKYTIDMSSDSCYLRYFSGKANPYVHQLTFSWCCQSPTTTNTSTTTAATTTAPHTTNAVDPGRMISGIRNDRQRVYQSFTLHLDKNKAEQSVMIS